MNEPLTTLSDKAYFAIRADIVAGKLAPGERLKISKLCNEYGIGASPLREALSKLSSEFLVFIEGQRGFSVTPIKMQELRDISQIRCQLEGEALKRAIENGGDEWEAGIVAAFYNLKKAEIRRKQDPIINAADWDAKNRAFHEALVAACDSDWLKRLRELLYFQHERYRRLSLQNLDPKRDLNAEHQAIMDATLEHNIELAVRLSEQHIEKTTNALLPIIKQLTGS